MADREKRVSCPPFGQVQDSPVWRRSAKGPGVRAFSEVGERNRKHGDWLAVDAVSCEPVSDQNSLLAGKITGNLAKNSLLATF